MIASYQNSHAYLIKGEDEEKTFECALELVEKIGGNNRDALLAKRIEDRLHPDVMVLSNEEKGLSIDAIRSVFDFIMIIPSELSKRFVIIKDAQELSSIVQNALLIVLEEPPTDCVIFLLATSSDSFLPTILSRTALIDISEQVSFEIDENEASYITNMLAEIIASRSIDKLLDAAAKLSKTDEETKAYLKYIYLCFEKIYTSRASALLAEPLASICSKEFCKKTMDNVTLALRDLKNNASRQLLFESVLINMLEDYYAENSRN